VPKNPFNNPMEYSPVFPQLLIARFSFLVPASDVVCLCLADTRKCGLQLQHCSTKQNIDRRQQSMLGEQTRARVWLVSSPEKGANFYVIKY